MNPANHSLNTDGQGGFVPETVDKASGNSLFERFDPRIAFAEGKIKLPDFRRGNISINRACEREGQQLSENPTDLETLVRTRFKPETLLPELFGKTEDSSIEFITIEPTASGRRLAFKVQFRFSDESSVRGAIFTPKDLRNEKRYAAYLALTGLSNYGIVCGTDDTERQCGAIEAIPGKSFGRTSSEEFQGFDEAIAFELGANFAAGYLLGKQDRCRSNYFFSSTPSKEGHLVTAIDHEDLFQLNPAVFRTAAHHEEIAILEDLPLYTSARSLLLERFEDGVSQQWEIALDRQGGIKAIIADGAPSFVGEFERRIDENPLEVLDKIYAFRARMERNIFANMKRTLLGRW